MDNIEEGGYGWVIVGISFVCMFVGNGIALSFGLMGPNIIHNLKATTSQAVAVGSTSFGLTFMTCIIICCLSNFVACKKISLSGAVLGVLACISSAFMTSIEGLTITFGILLGIALGMLNIPVLLLVNQYFHKKRAIAYGLAVSGTPIGTFVISLLMGVALKFLTIQTIYFIMAGVLAICGLLCLLLKPPAANEEKYCSLSIRNESSPNIIFRKFCAALIDGQVTQNCYFLFYLLGRSFASLGANIPHYVLPILIEQRAMEKSASSNAGIYNNKKVFCLMDNMIAFLVALLGLSNGLGRISSGLVSLYPKCLLVVQAAACIVAGISTMFFPHCPNADVLYVLTFVFGLVTGPVVALETVSCVAFVGQDYVGTSLGWVDFAYGFFSLMSPVVVGHLIDVYEEMFLPLYIIGGCHFCAAAIFLGTHFYLKKKGDDKEYQKF